MSRLYYDDPVKKSVSPETALETTTSGGSVAASATTNEDKVMEKMIKLIPSEIIAAYLSLIGFVNSFDWGYIIYVFFGLCLIMTPLYLNRLAQAGRPKRKHLIISTLAFVVWAIATSGNLLFDQLFDYKQAYGSALLVVFSLVSGLVSLDK